MLFDLKQFFIGTFLCFLVAFDLFIYLQNDYPFENLGFLEFISKFLTLCVYSFWHKFVDIKFKLILYVFTNHRSQRKLSLFFDLFCFFKNVWSLLCLKNLKLVVEYALTLEQPPLRRCFFYQKHTKLHIKKKKQKLNFYCILVYEK